MESFFALDYQLLHFIVTQLRTEILDAVMLFFSFLGDHGLVWILCGALLLLRPKTRRFGVALLVTLAVTAAVSEFGLKFLVERVRPFLQYDELLLLGPLPSGYSFPSSHAATAFACATVLFILKKPVGVWAYLLAAMIAFSRLYLCVHFPTDVAAGALLGVALGALVTFAVSRLSQRIHYAKLRQGSLK